jgi:hypothetical protein
MPFRVAAKEWSMDVSGMSDALRQIALWWLVFWALLSALFFGIPSAWLADEKGRGFISWLVLGTLLGPVGLLMVGFAPRGASGRYELCPACLEPIPVGASLCPHCRTALHEIAASGSTEENPYLRPASGRGAT